jgi:hypothetical protein
LCPPSSFGISTKQLHIGRGDWTVPENKKAAEQVVQQMTEFFNTLAEKREE